MGGLRWERHEIPPPCSYWSTDGRWGILPRRGSDDWELVDYSHDAVEVVDTGFTVREAKRRAVELSAREATDADR